MAFDKATRNLLASFVNKARNRIADEFTQKFQSIYGISSTGDIAPVDQLKHLDDNGLATAVLLRDRIEYLEKTHPEDKAGKRSAVTRLAREQAFTIVNRLAAIRMAEKRGLIVESVGKGYQSKGFKVFEQVAGTALGEIYHRYRRYLFCLFDELVVDLGALFDRRSPQALLFPRETALLDLLELINASELDQLWAEDETIGWIYQYYNDPAERKKMREESAAPRNSRELAVRNQFFTPRYVVEFLIDNTLGRIWYEMTKGETSLKEHCRYLVKRPAEIFLKSGETAPASVVTNDNLSQEELLKQPVYIAHRPMKDPRTIRMLDPACGSMHFGLYAFDLYEQIYSEAWEIETQFGKNIFIREDGLKPLTEYYHDKEEFLRDVPRLIIENNIHGVDIDPRAVQIAGLSLWLRAQKSWHGMGVKPVDRPRIMRSNIVCAEPMPGDKALLKEFTANLKIPALGYLVEQVFDKMQLAGEAGSLLKIEEEIRDIIAEAKSKWGALRDAPKQIALELPGLKSAPAEQLELELDLSGITNEQFWNKAEEKVYQTLKEYAESAGNGGGYQKRLFAEDAARGFAFIDVCRKQYECVVMNPPFGESPEGVLTLLKRTYILGRPDAYACFMFRAINILNKRGRCGCLSSRTFQNLEFFEKLRTALIETDAPVYLMVDLAGGVLDGATVETCATIFETKVENDDIIDPNTIFINIAIVESRDEVLKSSISDLNIGVTNSETFVRRRLWFKNLPGLVFSYALHKSAFNAFSRFNPINYKQALGNYSIENTEQADVLQGLIPGDLFRFVRATIELPLNKTVHDSWLKLCRGGEFQKFWADEPCSINWHAAGKEIMQFAEDNYGSASRTIKNIDHFGKKGITYPRISSIGLNARIMPANFSFSDAGMALIPKKENDCINLLGFLNSRIADYFASSIHPGRKFEIAHIASIPIPRTIMDDSLLFRLTNKAIEIAIALSKHNEDSSRYFLPNLLFNINDNLNVSFTYLNDNLVTLFKNYASILLSINSIVFQHFSMTSEDIFEINDIYIKSGHCKEDLKNCNTLYQFRRALEVWPELYESVGDNLIVEKQSEVSSLLSYFIGTLMGRWDIRFATGKRPVAELPDPFAPLPVCPPGMLQNEKGLPAEPNDVPANYPLRITWPGILVDDESHPTEDIILRIREAIEVIWKDKAASIEQEACEILGVKSLRDYFRKPSGFFADHLKRYSKSRRQAPIYWPLSTAKGSYTLWIYYHRLTDQTLHIAIADFLDPKLRSVRAEISMLRDSGNQNNRLEDLLDLEKELADFHDEIERIIKLPWKPNLNDGVIITASPLWKLFRFPKWQKDLKACWEKLEAGEFDWAHLAYSIWPDRVKKVCETDRSIAIAYDLESLYKEDLSKVKKTKKAKAGKSAVVKEEIIDSEVIDLMGDEA